MNDDLWQVPLLVMAGIILVELLIWVLSHREWWPGLPPKARTVALGLLALLVLGVGIMALGPDLADQLASVAAAIATLAALWLAWQSYKATRPAPDRSAPARQASARQAPARQAPARDDAGPTADLNEDDAPQT